MSALARRILPICLISGRCAPDCGMAQHGDGAVAWMVGASRPSPGQKDGTGALFAKPPPAHARGPRLTPRSRGLSLVSARPGYDPACGCRSDEHTSELQSLLRNSYAVFCLKKKK